MSQIEKNVKNDQNFSTYLRVHTATILGTLLTTFEVNLIKYRLSRYLIQTTYFVWVIIVYFSHYFFVEYL